MRTLWYILIMIGSVGGIFAPLTIWLNIQTTLDQKLVDSLNLYLLAGFITEGIILFFFSDLIQKKRDLRTDRKEHTKDLNQIYLRLTDISFTEEKKELVLTFPKDYKQFNNFDNLEQIFDRDYDPHMNRISRQYLYMYEDYYYFDYALEHLKHKSYKNIYEHWEKSNNIINEYNKSPKFIDKLEEKIKIKMQENFPDFKEATHLQYDDHFYKPRTILDVILDTIKYQTEEQEPNFEFLIIDRFGSGVWCICSKDYSISAQIGSIDKGKLDLEKYKQMLKSIIEDTEIKQMLELDSKKRLELFAELEKFSKELAVLIKKLKAGSILEGKCEGCSTFS